MVWVRLADDVADHPKLLSAGPLAAWLWVCGLAYCNRHLTDGFIPAGQVRRLADVDDPAELAVRLVDAGLWTVVSGGYAVHDYAQYQPSSDDVKRERKAAAERTAAWRERHKGTSQRDAGSNGVTDSVRDGIRTPSPARPGPVPGTRYPDPAGDPGPAGNPPSGPPLLTQAGDDPHVGNGVVKPTRRRRRPRPGEAQGPYGGGCPAGCPTSHGGPAAQRLLGADWLGLDVESRPSWPDFLCAHGRRDLASEPEPASVEV